jgi:hypothetical protein
VKSLLPVKIATSPFGYPSEGGESFFLLNSSSLIIYPEKYPPTPPQLKDNQLIAAFRGLQPAYNALPYIYSSTTHPGFSPNCRNCGIEALFRGIEVLFRETEVLFRETEALFREIEATVLSMERINFIIKLTDKNNKSY